METRIAIVIFCVSFFINVASILACLASDKIIMIFGLKAKTVTHRLVRLLPKCKETKQMDGKPITVEPETIRARTAAGELTTLGAFVIEAALIIISMITPRPGEKIIITAVGLTLAFIGFWINSRLRKKTLSELNVLRNKLIAEEQKKKKGSQGQAKNKKKRR